MFSPYMLGMEARRRSTCSPAEVSKEVRPSCGSRRSEMSMLPMILRRLITPGARPNGYSRNSCSTPSMRQRTRSRSSHGSMWISLALMLAASEIKASTVAITDSSIGGPVSGSGADPSLSPFRSLPRVLR